MKTFISFFILFSILLKSHAQSNAEIFEAQPGIMIEKTISELCDVPQLRILYIERKNISDLKILQSFEFVKVIGAGTMNMKVFNKEIDKEEAQNLTTILQAMETTVFNTTTDKNYYYRTKSGIQIEMYYSQSGNKWTCTIKIDEQEKYSSTSITLEDLKKISTSLQSKF